jgi:23S rRNA maturation-related 3'-5' exoribonuclease YhaM
VPVFKIKISKVMVMKHLLLSEHSEKEMYQTNTSCPKIVMFHLKTSLLAQLTSFAIRI